MAVLALVFAFVFSPLGIIFGVIGRRQIRLTGERGRGLATSGIVLGAVFIVLGVAFAAITLVAVSNAPLTVSKDQVAQEISTKVAEQLGSTPDSVLCPNDLPAQVGASVGCTLTIAGDSTPVTATVTSVTDGVANFDIISE